MLHRDLILFSTADWDAQFWTNKQHMAMQFAEHGWRVLYVDSLGLRQPSLNSKDIFRIFRRLKKSFPYPRQVHDRIWRVSPLVLPFHSHPAFRACNAVILRASILWHMYLLNMRTPLILTYNPTISSLCASLPHSSVIYHCVDNLCAAPHINSTIISEGERALASVADLCFTTSPLLQERMKLLFARTVYEPNVCDYALFSQARSECLPEPEAISRIPHPRALFIGALSQYKVDFDLLKSLAQRMPHVHWVLIGAEGEGQPDSRRVPQLHTIHHIGPKKHAELPAYMAHADVAILPAPHNAYTAAMFPMKFFEYLAAGLQVVTTNLPALQEFSHLCFMADGEDAFAERINEVLAGVKRDANRIDVACRYNSWNERFLRMQTVIDALPTRNSGTTTQKSVLAKPASQQIPQ